MTTLIYDGTYEGLLSAVFAVFERKLPEADLIAEDRYQEQLFSEPIRVDTRRDHARRVATGLDGRAKGAAKWLYHIFLTEQPGTERLILHYVRRQMRSAMDVRTDSSDERIRQLQHLKKQMGREVHRMHAFVRFQETPDGLYAALIEPDFNCLPLLGEHFGARYPAMDWLIYDTRRHYGLRWGSAVRKAEFVTLTRDGHGRLRQLDPDALADGETGYQELWQTYFRAVDIPERKNLSLHVQHVPKRYWKYLIEKTGRPD